MKLIELVGVIFLTVVLVGVLLPSMCFPPECGPPDALPYTTTQIIRAYLSHPITWVIIGLWTVSAFFWWRRADKGKSSS